MNWQEIIIKKINNRIECLKIEYKKYKYGRIYKGLSNFSFLLLVLHYKFE
jgi:hypothetical protein